MKNRIFDKTKKKFIHICNGVIYFQQFSKYLNYKKDNNDLLLYILRQLINDQNVYNRNKFGDSRQLGGSTEIQESEFLEKVR